MRQSLTYFTAVLLVATCCVVLSRAPAACAQASLTSSEDVNNMQQQQLELVESYPYYMQSPHVSTVTAAQPQQQQQQEQTDYKQQRATIPTMGDTASQPTASSFNLTSTARLANSAGLQQPLPGPIPLTSSNNNNNNNNGGAPVPPPLVPQQAPYLPVAQPPQAQCLYDKRYFLKLDQCLERKPYATVGLPAFRNDDLLIKKGLSDKYGCSFILTNGLFKNYVISRYALDSDTQCLDQDKTSSLSIQFSNVTLYYLWQLRCLNYADQLLDDATLGGRTMSSELLLTSGGTTYTGTGDKGSPAHSTSPAAICVGSSQNFGFAALQLANIEAQLELSVDIYKNWRVTNVTLAMAPHHPQQLHGAGKQQGDEYGNGPGQSQYQQREHGTYASTGIRDFTFETLDGDELNWRYLHLYENWTRNRLHVNFLEQFRRFLWVSMQRCLSESSEKLPVKLIDMFGHHKYN